MLGAESKAGEKILLARLHSAGSGRWVPRI